MHVKGCVQWKTTLFAFLYLLSITCHGAMIHHRKKVYKETPEYNNISSIFFCNESTIDSNSYVLGSETLQSENDVVLVSIKCSHVPGPTTLVNLTSDEYLQVDNKYIAPGQYCLANDASFAKLCRPHALNSWRKCCPDNQVMDGTYRKECVNSTQTFRPRINGELQSFDVMNVNPSHFKCPKGHHLKTLSTDTCSERSFTSKIFISELRNTVFHEMECDCRFQLSPNGSILYEVATGLFLRQSQWKELDHDHDHYCIDGVISPVSNCSQKQRYQETRVEISEVGTIISSTPFSPGCQQPEEMSAVLFVCVPDERSDEENDENLSVKVTLLAVIWSFTCPLLLAAAIINTCIIQKNVHGWILTCYLLSMVILNILSVVLISYPGHNHGGCRPIDFIIKFMYMSTLCWMTSINFGLWKTFRYTLPQPVGLRRFIMSIIFSLGFPAISVTICFFVAYLGTNPYCKHEQCLLYSYSTIPFYSVPVLLLVLGNFAIFLRTSFTITSLRRANDDILRRQAQDHVDSFALFTKLFLLTGSIWLLRLVLFILQLKGLYMSWYGVMLEVLFSVPEVVFPMIVFHHMEFIRWSWNMFPGISRCIIKFDPIFHVTTTK